MGWERGSDNGAVPWHVELNQRPDIVNGEGAAASDRSVGDLRQRWAVLLGVGYAVCHLPGRATRDVDVSKHLTRPEKVLIFSRILNT